MGRHERMKRGIGMKDRDERFRGIEIRIVDAFTKKFDTILDFYVSSLHRDHVNPLCIVPILTDDLRRGFLFCLFPED